MRIGYDAKRLFSNFAGLGNYSRTLVHNFSTQHPDHELCLYTPKVLDHPVTKEFISSDRYHTYVKSKGNKTLWRSRGIIKQLARDGVDIYHGLSHELPFGIHREALKTVVTIHDLVYRVRPQDNPWTDRVIFDAKFKYACRYADRIIAISESTKQDIVRYFGTDPARISVVYQACDPVFYGPHENGGFAYLQEKYHLPKEYLLAVGSLFPRKNIGTLLQAMALLPPTERIPLVLVGKGKMKTALLTAAKALGIGGLLHWVEDLHDHADLRTLYGQAQAFVYPTYYEGFGLPIVEAMLSQTPVITSNTSSLPEAGGVHAKQVDPNSPEAFAAAIQEVLSDTTLRQQMVQGGLDYATKRYSPTATTLALAKVYEALMNA